MSARICPALLKYKGKTNEMFTDTMLTMALASSAFMPVHDSQLIVCDPMAGRGTTLMLALRRGYHGVGIEIDKADVKESADYMTRYLEFHRTKYKRTDSSLTVRGKTAVGKISLSFPTAPSILRMAIRARSA